MIQYSVFFLLLARNILCNITTSCGGNQLTLSYLDVAVDMITKANTNIQTCSDTGVNFTRGPLDCADVWRAGQRKNGVYTIWPMNRLTEDRSLDVYCDMTTDGGGWTLIQRRGDFQRPADFFFKDWKSYKEGFGDMQKDFWLGNDNIFALSNQKLYSVRFDLQDMESNKRYAQYDSFWIDGESNKYMLHIADFSGDAGDSMMVQHNNQKFSTKDKDNDNKADNCAESYKGGWWYNNCHHSNLNGLYLKGKHESFANGVNWLSWKGYKESLQSTEIKLRPKKFRVMGTPASMTPQR